MYKQQLETMNKRMLDKNGEIENVASKTQLRMQQPKKDNQKMIIDHKNQSKNNNEHRITVEKDLRNLIEAREAMKKKIQIIQLKSDQKQQQQQQPSAGGGGMSIDSNESTTTVPHVLKEAKRISGGCSVGYKKNNLNLQTKTVKIDTRQLANKHKQPVFKYLNPILESKVKFFRNNWGSGGQKLGTAEPQLSLKKETVGPPTRTQNFLKNIEKSLGKAKRTSSTTTTGSNKILSKIYGGSKETILKYGGLNKNASHSGECSSKFNHSLKLQKLQSSTQIERILSKDTGKGNLKKDINQSMSEKKMFLLMPKRKIDTSISQVLLSQRKTRAMCDNKSTYGQQFKKVLKPQNKNSTNSIMTRVSNLRLSEPQKSISSTTFVVENPLLIFGPPSQSKQSMKESSSDNGGTDDSMLTTASDQALLQSLAQSGAGETTSIDSCCSTYSLHSAKALAPNERTISTTTFVLKRSERKIDESLESISEQDVSNLRMSIGNLKVDNSTSSETPSMSNGPSESDIFQSDSSSFDSEDILYAYLRIMTEKKLEESRVHGSA